MGSCTQLTYKTVQELIIELLDGLTASRSLVTQSYWLVSTKRPSVNHAISQLTDCLAIWHRLAHLAHSLHSQSHFPVLRFTKHDLSHSLSDLRSQHSNFACPANGRDHLVGACDSTRSHHLTWRMPQNDGHLGANDLVRNRQSHELIERRVKALCCRRYCDARSWNCDATSDWGSL